MSMVCPSCGYDNIEGSRWCGKCRYDLQGEYLKHTKKSFVLGTILLVIYCLLSVYAIISDIHNLRLIGRFILRDISYILKYADFIFGAAILAFHFVSRFKAKKIYGLQIAFLGYNMIHYLTYFVFSRMTADNFRLSFHHSIYELFVPLLALAYIIISWWKSTERWCKADIALLSSFCLLAISVLVREGFYDLPDFSISFWGLTRGIDSLLKYADIVIGLIVLSCILAGKENLLIKRAFLFYCLFHFIQDILLWCSFIRGFSENQIPFIGSYITEFIIYGLCMFVAVPVLYCIQKRNRGHSL
jgi:hypothetical protein